MKTTNKAVKKLTKAIVDDLVRYEVIDYNVELKTIHRIIYDCLMVEHNQPTLQGQKRPPYEKNK